MGFIVNSRGWVMAGSWLCRGGAGAGFQPNGADIGVIDRR
jgi:hypothetical protein